MLKRRIILLGWTLLLLAAFLVGGVLFWKYTTKPVVSVRVAAQLLRSEEMKFLVLRKIVSTVVLERKEKNWFWGDRDGVALAEVELFYGFDLSGIAEKDFRATDNGLELTLPDPEVLTVSVDLTTLRVLTRQSALSFWRDKALSSALADELRTHFAEAARKQFRDRRQLPERRELVALMNHWAGPRFAAAGVLITFK